MSSWTHSVFSPDGSPASDTTTAGSDADVEADGGEEIECKDGVCEIPEKSNASLEDAMTMTKRLSNEMDVDETIVYAAIGATMTLGEGSEEERLNEGAAREMIQNEVNAIARVMEDCEEVRVYWHVLFPIQYPKRICSNSSTIFATSFFLFKLLFRQRSQSLLLKGMISICQDELLHLRI